MRVLYIFQFSDHMVVIVNSTIYSLYTPYHHNYSVVMNKKRQLIKSKTRYTNYYNNIKKVDFVEHN